MPLSKYLLYCHATLSVRLVVGCRRLEQIIPHIIMNVQLKPSVSESSESKSELFSEVLVWESESYSESLDRSYVSLSLALFLSLFRVPVCEKSRARATSAALLPGTWRLLWARYIWNSANRFSRWRNITFIHIKTDKACLRDLFDSHCFIGEAEKQVHDFALHRISSIN